MPTIGKYLKEGREKRNISLEEVSRRTRILFTILKELEKDNLLALPDKTYLKGFVRAYAKEVNLDVNLALNLLESTYEKVVISAQNSIFTAIDTGTLTDNTENDSSFSSNESIISSCTSELKTKRKKLDSRANPDYNSEIGQTHALLSPRYKLMLKILGAVSLVMIIISIPIYYIYTAVQDDFRARQENANKNLNNISPATVNFATMITSATSTTSAHSPEILNLLPVFQGESDDLDLVTNNTVNPNANITKNNFNKNNARLPNRTIPSPYNITTTTPLTHNTTNSADQNRPNNISSNPNPLNNKKINDNGDTNNQSLTSKELEEAGAKIQFRKMNVPSYHTRPLDSEQDSESNYHNTNSQNEDNTTPENYKNNLPAHIKNAFIPKQENIYIRAENGDTWVTYKKDDDLTQNFTLRKGRGLLIQGREIRLRIGNINATKLFYNNRILTLDSGNNNGVKSFIFPAANAGKYYLPLFVTLKNGQIVTSDELKKKRLTQT